MDAAGHLAGSIQAGDGVAHDVHGLVVGVDAHAAHAVVDAGVHGDGVERRGLERLDETGGAAERVLGAADALVVGVDRRLQRVGRDTERVGEAGQVVSLDAHLAVLIAGAGAVVVVDGLVVDDPDLAAVLLELGGRHDVAGVHLVDEALAGVVHQDGAAAADALGDEGAAGVDGGVDLDLAHLNEVGAGLLRHDHAVAGDAGGVRGDERGEVGTVLGDHVGVGAEAAGAQDDGLGAVGGAVLAGDAAHRAGLVLHELGRADVVDDLDAGVLDGRGHGRDVGGADGRPVGGTVAALHRHAAGGGDVVEHQAVGGEPVDGGGGALAHRGHEVDVAPVVAADQRLADEQVGRVLDALLLLVGGLGGVHARRGVARVAAREGALLEDDDLLDAGLFGGQRGAHARAAHAHDDDVVVAAGSGPVGGLVGRGFLGPVGGLVGRGFLGLVGERRDGAHAQGGRGHGRGADERATVHLDVCHR